MQHAWLGRGFFARRRSSFRPRAHAVRAFTCPACLTPVTSVVPSLKPYDVRTACGGHARSDTLSTAGTGVHLRRAEAPRMIRFVACWCALLLAVLSGVAGDDTRARGCPMHFPFPTLSPPVRDSLPFGPTGYPLEFTGELLSLFARETHGTNYGTHGGAPSSRACSRSTIRASLGAMSTPSSEACTVYAPGAHAVTRMA